MVVQAHIKQPRIDWSLTALLTVQAVTLFIATPLGTISPQGHTLLDVCHVSFAVVSVAALTRHRLIQMALLMSLAVLVGGPAIIGHLRLDLGFAVDKTSQHEAIELVAFGFNAVVTGLVAVHVFGPGRVTAHRVQGAVLIYLNIAALFAIAFGAVLARWPDSIILTTGAPLSTVNGTRTAALTYFSISTITTTGFGDLVPVHPLARSLANLESVVGQLFPATLLARIVALNIEHSRRDGRSPDVSADSL